MRSHAREAGDSRARARRSLSGARHYMTFSWEHIPQAQKLGEERWQAQEAATTVVARSLISLME